MVKEIASGDCVSIGIMQAGDRNFLNDSQPMVTAIATMTTTAKENLYINN